MSVDFIKIDLPASLNPSQIEILPLANNIGEGNLLTSLKIATAYNIPSGNGTGVKVGIVSLGGGFSQADLNKSMANLGLTTGNVTFVGVDGAVNSYTGNPNSADGENMLDLVCVAGMVPNANVVLYKGNNSSVSYSPNVAYANSLNNNSSFGNAIQRAVDDDCDVISISWGLTEKAISANISYYCGDYLAGPLANAAAKGISVFVASGDYGSQAQYSTNPVFQIVSADYPSVNANVTAVGGTYLTLTGGNTRLAETVYNNSVITGGVGGGGGVSGMISLPSYQANLNYKTYPANVTSTLTMRGIPDISAAMNAYGVWMTYTSNSVSQIYGFSGTSASAPIMAGMVARFISLNGGRRPPNGSAGLNSILYNHTSNFYDITTGNNASLLANGYSSTTGWDATVGLGPQLNAIATYQAVTSAGLAIKNSGNTWGTVGNVYIKTGASTWANVQYIWTKTANGWAQSY